MLQNKRQEYDDSLSSEEQITYFETEKTRYLVEKIHEQSKKISAQRILFILF
jgi:hypothetical protein